jgi:hypothetical protein
MKPKYILHLVLITIILIIASACSGGKNETSDFPQVGLTENLMNKEMKIEDLPQFFNSFENDKGINLHLINLSNKTIIYPSDTKIRLFTKEDGIWKQVVNDIHGSIESNILLPTKEFPPGQVISIVPRISNLTEPQIVRVIVIGHFENEADKLVGAYLDVMIKP